MPEYLINDQAIKAALTAAIWLAVADAVLVSGLLAGYVLRTVRRWTRFDE